MEVVTAAHNRQWYEKSRLIPYLTTYIRLPTSLVKKVRQVQDELRHTDPRQIYSPESYLHITVKEFGWLGEGVKIEDVPEVLKTVRRIASDRRPFEISVDGLGIWPSVIYGEVRKGADEIRELHMKLIRELGDKVAHSKYDGEAMHPHVSIMHFATQDVEPLLRKARSMATRSMGEATVGELQVVKSYPHRLFDSASEQERVNEPVATFRFERSD
jgi:2'-5' RNA ligase